MNITLDAFVVMPNHFHAMIIIGENEFNGGRDATDRVSTTIGDTGCFADGKLGPQLKNLASVVRGFKPAVTKYLRKNHIEFDWQGRFHDHSIRNNFLANPAANWFRDTFNHGNSDKME
jgi:REP element-mobilizing transposase RayT